jgi:hypothetical protein
MIEPFGKDGKTFAKMVPEVKRFPAMRRSGNLAVGVLLHEQNGSKVIGPLLGRRDAGDFALERLAPAVDGI